MENKEELVPEMPAEENAGAEFQALTVAPAEPTVSSVKWEESGKCGYFNRNAGSD
jgi:hypothetical protein